MISDLEDCANAGEINHNDSVIFNAAMLRTDEEKLASITVGSPIERNGKIFYTVKAFDSKGEFEIQRRFSDFEFLRKAFT